MSGFSPNQLRLLTAKLDRSHVRQRQADGRSLSYIEGWFAIAEANGIFGYGGWDRQMVRFERTFASSRDDLSHCGFMARVRINVRVQGPTIIREGTGFGSASSPSLTEAYDRAIKAAETDATKRALATFGNRFGLCLYDREQRGVEDSPQNAEASGMSKSANIFQLHSPEGAILASSLSAEGYCTGLRQLVEACRNLRELETLKSLNAEQLARLRDLRPHLCNRSGTHFADLLSSLMERRRDKILSVLPSVEPPVLSGPLEQDAIVPEIIPETKIEPPTTSTPPGPTEIARGVHSQKALCEGAIPPENQNDQAGGHAPATVAAKEQTEFLPPSRITSGPRINKSALSIGSARRMRDPDHFCAQAFLPNLRENTLSRPSCEICAAARPQHESER